MRSNEPGFIETCQSLLGHNVRATIGEDSLPPIQHVGILIGFTSDGEVDIRESTGQMVFAWPLLAIEPA